MALHVSHDSKLGDQLVRLLEHLPKLEYFDYWMNFNSLTEPELAAVAGRKDLRRLVLWQHKLTNEQARRFAGMVKLRHLNLGGGGEITFEIVADLTPLVELRDLHLESMQRGPHGLQALAEFKHLETLGLAFSAVNDDDLIDIAACKRLKRLHLARTAITDAGLARLHGLRSLEYLNVAGTGVTPEGIASFQAVLPNCKVQTVDEPLPDSFGFPWAPAE
jgi:hypothetical protein